MNALVAEKTASTPDTQVALVIDKNKLKCTVWSTDIHLDA